MPKDRKKKPFSCFSKNSLLRDDDVQLENDQVFGWCGTCDLHAKENGESIMNIMNISSIIRKLLKLHAGSAHIQISCQPLPARGHSLSRPSFNKHNIQRHVKIIEQRTLLSLYLAIKFKIFWRGGLHTVL